MLTLELVTTINLNDSLINYEYDLPEIDSYWLEDVDTGQAIFFIWDHDLTIKINCTSFGSSLVINSPLTKELENFQRQRFQLFQVPVIKMDSILSAYRQSAVAKTASGKKTLDSLQLKANNLTNDSKKQFFSYTLEYARNHPDSFLSLYYLTFTGEEAESSNRYAGEYKEAFKTLSPELKKHSRARIYDQ